LIVKYPVNGSEEQANDPEFKRLIAKITEELGRQTQDTKAT